MNLIKDIFSLEKAIENYKNIIIYGAGDTLKCLLSYLTMRHLDQKVLCIAVKDKLGSPESVMEKPILYLEDLVHLRCESLIIVAMKEHLFDEIENFINEKKFQEMAFCTNELVIEMDSMCMKSDFKRMMLEELHQMEKFRMEMEIRIEESAEICRGNTDTFKLYRNMYYGRDVAIVATGPTVRDYSPLDNVIHIGVNGAWKNKQIPLDYLFVQDLGPERWNLENIKVGLDEFSGRIFIGRYTKRAMHRLNGFPEEFFLDNQKVSKYFVTASSTNEPIYQDICMHPLMDCYSVVFPAIHFALFTYPRRLYLIGCDMGGIGHFYDDKPENLEKTHAFDKMKVGFGRVKRFAHTYYPKTEIISVNPMGLKGLFKEISI